MAELDWCILQIQSNPAIKGASMPFYIQIVIILHPYMLDQVHMDMVPISFSPEY